MQQCYMLKGKIPNQRTHVKMQPDIASYCVPKNGSMGFGLVRSSIIICSVLILFWHLKLTYQTSTSPFTNGCCHSLLTISFRTQAKPKVMLPTKLNLQNKRSNQIEAYKQQGDTEALAVLWTQISETTLASAATDSEGQPLNFKGDFFGRCKRS